MLGNENTPPTAAGVAAAEAGAGVAAVEAGAGVAAVEAGAGVATGAPLQSTQKI